MGKEIKMFVILYKDIEGKTHWIDDEGNCSLDSQEMTEGNAEMAVTAFKESVPEVILTELERGWAKIDIYPADYFDNN